MNNKRMGKQWVCLLAIPNFDSKKKYLARKMLESNIMYGGLRAIITVCCQVRYIDQSGKLARGRP